jgi:membrane protein required for colicin V production
MHYLDIIAIALIVILGVRGFFTGLIREICSLLGVILGFIVGSRLALFVGRKASEHVHFASEGAMELAGFVSLFVLIWLFFFLLGIVLFKIVRKRNGGIVRKTVLILDRLGGFLINVLKIFVIFSVAIYMLSRVHVVADFAEKKLSDSFMYPIFKNFGDLIMYFDNGNNANKLQQKAEEIAKEKLEEVQESLQESLQEQKDSVQKQIESVFEATTSEENNEQ